MIRWAYHAKSAEGAPRVQFALEVDAGAVVDRRHTRCLGGAHVGDRVVDEQQFARRTPYAREQDFVDARIGLGDAHVARDDAGVELVKEGVLRPRKDEFLGGEVAERMNWAVGRAQTPQQRDILVDGTAERFDPARVEKSQRLGELGKGFRALGDGLREIRRDVSVGDEVHAAGGGQKALHLRLVAEHLSEKIAPIPAHENIADVKNDDQGECPSGGEGRPLLTRQTALPEPVSANGKDSQSDSVEISMLSGPAQPNNSSSPVRETG